MLRKGGMFMENKIFSLADMLKLLKNTKSELAEAVKANNAGIEKVELELANLMVTEELQSFNRNNTLFYLNTKLYASAKADKKIELYDALKDNGFGSLITETVNANSLAAFVREQIENNEDKLPDWLNGRVNVYDKVSVGLRKA